MSKFSIKEYRLMESSSVDYLTLTRRKLDEDESELLLDVTHTYCYSKRKTFLRENERGYDKKRIFKIFFKLLKKKCVRKLFLNGLIEEDALLKGLAKKNKFKVEKLIYDSSTDNNIVEKFKSKCENLEHTERLEKDNSTVETNWCHLPMKLRQKCVDSMCFMTKMNLRQTSSTEKALVEYKKHDFDYIGIYSFPRNTYNFADTTIYIRSKVDAIDSRGLATLDDYNVFDFDRKSSFHEKKLKMICSILKFGSIKTLFTNGRLNFQKRAEIAAQIDACAPFDIKQLSMKEREGYYHIHLPKNVGVGLETLEMKWMLREDIKEMLDNPKVLSVLMNLKHLQINETNLLEVTNLIVTAWIQNNKAIGSRLLERAYSDNFKELRDHYENQAASRVVNANETEIRIRTDNAESHILMRVFPWQREPKGIVLVVEVIPASLQPSEFTTEHGWLRLEKEVPI